MPVLVLASTPLGNIFDLTIRTLQEMQSSCLNLVEDVRSYRRLLALANSDLSPHFSSNPLFSPYHFFAASESSAANTPEFLDTLLHTLESGSCSDIFQFFFGSAQESKYFNEFSARYVANHGRWLYLSEGGASFFEDPGFALAAVARQRGWQIEILPGANAFVTAMGYYPGHSRSFTFAGFLPREKEERLQILTGWCRNLKEPLAFYETPYRLPRLSQELQKICSRDIQILFAYELTTPQQVIWSGSLAAIHRAFPEGFPKGNAVFLLYRK